MIYVIDIGLSNIGNVTKVLNKNKAEFRVIQEPNELTPEDGLILPGVGNFGSAVKVIDHRGLRDYLINAYKNNISYLGICLGMQLLGTYSEEADGEGLGIIKSPVESLKDFGEHVPHIGWNGVNVRKEALLPGFEIKTGDYYFVHSYAFKFANDENIVATSVYGDKFISIIKSNNFIGMQFHPEKSQSLGIDIIKSFVSYVEKANYTDRNN